MPKTKAKKKVVTKKKPQYFHLEFECLPDDWSHSSSYNYSYRTRREANLAAKEASKDGFKVKYRVAVGKNRNKE